MVKTVADLQRIIINMPMRTPVLFFDAEGGDVLRHGMEVEIREMVVDEHGNYYDVISNHSRRITMYPPEGSETRAVTTLCFW